MPLSGVGLSKSLSSLTGTTPLGVPISSITPHIRSRGARAQRLEHGDSRLTVPPPIRLPRVALGLGQHDLVRSGPTSANRRPSVLRRNIESAMNEKQSTGLAVGVALGAAIGVAMDSIGIAMALSFNGGPG